MMNFKKSHRQDSPILICNVWDVSSAQTAQKLGFTAIGTSSGAIAAMLGYEDGEKMSFSELEYIVQRILSSVQLPLSVDLEAGYSRDTKVIVNHIERLHQLGVVGINIEDSLVNEQREMVDGEAFSKTLTAIKNDLKSKNINAFINVRTDPFLLGHPNPVEEIIKRAKLYQYAGADGIFIPCIEKEADIRQVAENIDLPVNVMCMPNLPDFSTLQRFGVKRISMGNFIHAEMIKQLEQTLSKIQNAKSFRPIFS